MIFISRLEGGATSSNPAIPTFDNLAALLTVEMIHVSDAIENTADRGQTGSYRGINNSTSAILYYAPRVVGQRTATAVLTYEWNQLGQGENGIAFDVYREESRSSDIVRSRAALDTKVIEGDLGYEIENVI